MCVHTGVCPCHRFIESLYCVNVSNGSTLLKNAGSTFLCPLHPITSCSEWQPHEPLKPSHHTRSTVERPARGWKGIQREAHAKKRCNWQTVVKWVNTIWEFSREFLTKSRLVSNLFIFFSAVRFLNARNDFVLIICQFITTLLFPRVYIGGVIINIYHNCSPCFMEFVPPVFPRLLELLENERLL